MCPTSTENGKSGIPKHMDIDTDPIAEVLEGYDIVAGLMLGYVGSMTLNAAVLLGIPDIIAKAGPTATLSLEEIAAQLRTTSTDQSVNTQYLYRILKPLVAYGVFSATRVTSESGKISTRYGLTKASKLLVREKNGLRLAPGVIMQMHKAAQAPWYHLHESVLHGRTPFTTAHGKNMWEYINENPEFGKVVNECQASFSSAMMDTFLSKYTGFKDVKTLVDVCGGLGKNIGAIVAVHPHIHGINFDLPHIVARAPKIRGVENVAGNILAEIPRGDAIFMQRILHDWDDEHCVRILSNCCRTLPTNSKVIICEVVMPPDEDDNPPRIATVALDLVMLAHSYGGMERTEAQWRRLIYAAGFPRVNFEQLCTHFYVVEALK